MTPTFSLATGLLSRLRRDARACGAGGAAALLAVLALPGLHTWSHRADHTHGAAGEIVPLAHLVGAHAEAHAHGRAHSHGSGVPFEAADAAPPLRPSAPAAMPDEAADRVAAATPRHDSQGAAHFGLGIVATPTFAVAAPAAPVTSADEAPPESSCARELPDANRARGPPTSSQV